MATEILDRSKSYLRIFVDPVEVDYTLPKYNAILKKMEEGKAGVVTVTKDYSTVDRAVKDQEISIFDSYEKRKALARLKSQQVISQEVFDSMSADELNFLVDERRARGISRSEITVPTPVRNVWAEEVDDLFDVVDASNVKIVPPPVKSKSWIKGVIDKILKKKDEHDMDRIPDEDPEEKPKTYKIDVIKFFDLVKLTTQKEAEDYYGRIGSYLAALKDAKEMGQTALVDQWLGRLFTVKYESILRSRGFEKKITEAQLVSFVKESEKGISLSYIKNFSRPIPKEVKERKLEADSLHVFDNYVVLSYDPEGRAYKETKEENELERQKKADPILFGIISGNRCLYYIADWVDDYCDLTLDKFLEVSGILENNIKISEKYEI